MPEIISKSEDETARLAQRIAGKSQPGDIFALRGELGSGKTFFAKNFAKALSIKEEITSPTFNIVKSYDFSKSGQELKLFHLDVYRLGKISQSDLMEFGDIFNQKEAIFLVEWPERLDEIIDTLERNRVKFIDFEYIDSNSRQLSFAEGIL